MAKLKRGDLAVVPGTNEIVIIIREGNNVIKFSERFKSGTVGGATVVGRLSDDLAKLYWQREKRNDPRFPTSCR